MTLYEKLMRPRKIKLMHPKSPGKYVTVTRTWIGRLFKSKYFATEAEARRNK